MSAASEPAKASALSDRLFRGLWIANVGSGIGASIHDTAAVWTLTLQTDKAWVVTLFQSLLSFPLFLLALPAGAVADIVDKRRHIVRIQIAGAVVAFTMTASAAFGFVPPWLLLGGAVVFGCLMAFGWPAWQALIPEVIEKPLMGSAITLGGLGVNLARAIGPFVGGYVVAWFGSAPAFALNAVSFLGLAWVLWRWKRDAPPPKPHAETVASAMIAAIRHVRYSPAIQRVLVRHGIYTFAAFAPVALLPLVVRSLGLPGSSFGALMGVYGLGGIVVALFAMPWLKKRFGVDALTTMAGVVSLLAAVSLPFARTQEVLMAILFPAGGAWLVSMAQLNFAGQSVFPHWVRARASAIQLLAAQGGVALGALLWGDLTERFGLGVAFWAAAGVLGGYLVATRLLRVDEELKADLSAVAHDHRHDGLAFEPAAEAGPVRICVRYRVDGADEAAFIQAILELRSMRLRDGAFRWHLWRDLEQAGVFHEGFLVGSWMEHLRQADRMTRKARDLEDRVISFHRGDSPPEVSHSIAVEGEWRPARLPATAEVAG